MDARQCFIRGSAYGGADIMTDCSVMDSALREMRGRCGKVEMCPTGTNYGELPEPAPDPRGMVAAAKGGELKPADIGIAEFLRDRGYRYVGDVVMRFDGRFLQPSSENAMYAEVVEGLRDVGCKTLLARSRFSDIVSYWQVIADPSRVASDTATAELEADYGGWLIPFENGLLNVGQARMVPFIPDVAFEGHIHARYDPDVALDPGVEGRIRGVWRGILGSDEMVDFMLTCIGYTLYSEVLSPPALFVLMGPGGTGKSAVLNTIERMLGSERVSSMSPSKLSTQFGLSRLRGMAANLCDEAGDASGARVDSDLLKALAAGRPWDMEQKYKDISRFVNKAKLWFAANSIPDFGDTSSGMMRRMVIFPCVTRQDPAARIYDALGSEEGLAWLAYHSLKAFLEFLWSGACEFEPPQSVLDMRFDFCMQESLCEFLSEAVGSLDREAIRNWLDGRTMGEVYDAYVESMVESGRGRPMPRTQVRSKLCTEYNMCMRRTTLRFDASRKTVYVFACKTDAIAPTAAELAEPKSQEELDADARKRAEGRKAAADRLRSEREAEQRSKEEEEYALQHRAPAPPSAPSPAPSSAGNGRDKKDDGDDGAEMKELDIIDDFTEEGL